MDIKLRESQQTAYHAMCKDNIGIIQMFCGTGKTRVIFKYVIEQNNDLTIIVFPRIILIKHLYYIHFIFIFILKFFNIYDILLHTIHD